MTAFPPYPAEPETAEERAPFDGRRPSLVNPPLIALALTIVFLVALLVMVLLDGDRAATDYIPTREPDVTESQPATSTTDGRDGAERATPLLATRLRHAAH